MDLPLRIVDGVPDEPVISVDGAWDAPGLNLSHWPGHRTPSELRHDLSTGSALAFARLDPGRRAELAGDCTAICNNHYDTDGTCALFAVSRPEAALQRADALLAAAACGDLYRVPDEGALAVDAIVEGCSRTAEGATELERHQAATERLMEALPAILDGDREPYREMWEPALEAWRAEAADLEAAERVDLVHLDWTIWIARPGARAPGRHALFGASEADRALAVVPADGGATYRFVVNTTSWFDLVTRAAQPRPDLEALAGTLNELEGTDPAAELAWRTQPITNAAPELWFGLADQPFFQEHNRRLRPSALEPAAVRRQVTEALRASLVLPS